MASPAKKVIKKKKERKNIPKGVAHIQATFNNTMITITDPVGNVIAWSTSGVVRAATASTPTRIRTSWTSARAARRIPTSTPTASTHRR